MSKKCGFWVLALAFLALFSVLAPSQANASASDPCANSTLGESALKNAAAYQQEKSSYLHGVAQSFPFVSATNSCVENIMKIFNMMPSLSDTFGMMGMIINAIVSGILNQVCSAVMGAISSVQSSITNMAKVCLPSISFGGIGSLNLNYSSCSGGTTISPISGWSNSSDPTRDFDYYYGRAFR